MDKLKTEYQSPFSTRYRSSKEILELFSEQKKFSTWRQLWIWLAEGEMELGYPITEDQIEEMRQNVTNIDWEFIAAKEKETRHDVMAHILGFKQICPKAAGIIHLGATSAYVQDNTDLILIKEAQRITLSKVAKCVHRLSLLADRYKSVATLGRTHYQAASVTTVGKRISSWTQDIMMAAAQLEFAAQNLRFRGIKGATGTQDSFLKLLDHDSSKVDMLNQIVTLKAGFIHSFIITGQTYPRLQDCAVLNGFAMLGSAIHKVCMDIRLLQASGEVFEPFETNQIGSSAMPYKKNPIRCERCCGFARHLSSLAQEALQTASIQGFERTLDDSSSRRITIPETFLTADVILTTFQNIVEGLRVNEAVILKNLQGELQFLAMETVLMEVVKLGKDRQQAHEKIRQISLAASEKITAGEKVDLVAEIMRDEYFAGLKDQIPDVLDPENYVGMCQKQVVAFLEREVGPFLKKYPGCTVGKSDLNL